MLWDLFRWSVFHLFLVIRDKVIYSYSVSPSFVVFRRLSPSFAVFWVILRTPANAVTETLEQQQHEMSKCKNVRIYKKYRHILKTKRVVKIKTFSIFV